MQFVVFQQQGAWRWILRDGVEVVARGLTSPSRADVVREAIQFKEAVGASKLVFEPNHAGALR